LRTTLWPLNADDEENLDRRSDPQCTNHVYLISYIWYATKENKLDLKNKNKNKNIIPRTQGMCCVQGV